MTLTIRMMYNGWHTQQEEVKKRIHQPIVDDGIR